MAKEVKPVEVENPFEAFLFLDEPTKAAPKEKAPKEPKEKEATPVVTDITPEAEAALEAATKEAEEATKKREAKKKDVEIEEVEIEDLETEPVVEIVEETNTNEFLGFAKFLDEEGVVYLEDTDKVESEKDLLKIVDKTVNRRVEEYKGSLPEDGQKFLEFVQNGGKPSDFHKFYYGEASFEDFTIDTEEDQKHVITEALKLEEYSDEEIEDYIKDAEDLGKLDKKAETALRKVQKFEKEQKKALLEAQKAYAEEQKRLQEAEWDNFQKGLYEKDVIAGFKFTKKMKDDTWEYMTKPVNKKTGETQYQIDSKENEDARYLYAYLLKNKYNLETLERQVETKQVSKLKAKLSNYSDSRQKIKSGTSPKGDNGENNSFAAFRTALNS